MQDKYTEKKLICVDSSPKESKSSRKIFCFATAGDEK